MTQGKLHRELQAFLSKHPRALVELPRDHGKSTQVCIRLVWELGRNPNLRIVLVGAAENLAAQRGRFLRTAIDDNVRVKLVFPELQPWCPWAVDGFAVKRDGSVIGPSVSAFGLGACSTGSRADLLVCDDIVDVRSVTSAAERERSSTEFFNNVLNLLEPDGRFWGLFTPWHGDDVNARLKRSGEFQLFRRPIGADLQPIWPERWTKKSLLKRKREIGETAFARGYRLTPIVPEEVVIRPEWVTTFDATAEYDRVILSVDPAVSVKAKADATALVVLGQVGNEIHCLAAEAKKLTAPDLLKTLTAWHERWNPETIVFETNGAFEAVKELLVRHAAFGPKVLGVKQSSAKGARFAAFAVTVQNRAFQVRGDGSQSALIEEMTTFPFGPHDDLLDAAATGTSYLLGAPREPRLWIVDVPLVRKVGLAKW